MSAEKILVHKSISAAFITTLKEKVASMYGDSQVMILPTSAAKVEGLIVAASESGATLHHTPMESSNPHDHQNVIITGVTSDMDIWHTETFGPVVMVVDFVTEEEAVEKANDTEYGLSAAVWTRDLGRGIRIAKQIESGYVEVRMEIMVHGLNGIIIL